MIGLSRIVSSFLNRVTHKATAAICGKQINRGAGLGLEIPVIYKIYGGRKYLDRLDELINGSETAKSALREREDEGILVNGQQKKRKSTKKEKVNKSRKRKFQMCATVQSCRSVSALTRVKTIKL